MRIGSRALIVGLPSLLLAIACLSGENQCLNPHPDLPSCRGTDNNPGSFGGKSSVAGAPGTNTGNPSSGGTSASGSAGRASTGGGNEPNEGAAGSSSDDAGGAGGDSALEPGVDGGAGGAAGSDNGPF